MTPVARVLAGVLGLLVWATSAPAQSLSATPSPFGSGATITVTTQSATPPYPGQDICGSACYVIASYAFVYIQRGSASGRRDMSPRLRLAGWQYLLCPAPAIASAGRSRLDRSTA